MKSPLEIYLNDAAVLFKRYKTLAEKAVARVDEDEFFRQPDAESNSIAINIKHMAGSMRSRWRDFLTSDGEKADRNRDSEFIRSGEDSRESLMQFWNKSWDLLFEEMRKLRADDLGRKVTIRGEPLTVIEAINRQLTHCAYHVGQIVYLARHWAKEWDSLSVPKGKSEEFNRRMNMKFGGGENQN